LRKKEQARACCKSTFSRRVRDLILVRHGQSEWNAAYTRTRIDPNIPDPPLTAEGRRQAADAAASLAELRIERLLTSPYARALETAEIIAARLQVPVVVEPLVRERAAFSCDIGTPRSRLAARWPLLRFDHVDEIWWPGTEETDDQLWDRCDRFRVAVRTLQDWQNVAVVTHWGFIRAIAGIETRNGEWARLDPHRALAR
jgi:broad specificity phosphatase PhoE